MFQISLKSNKLFFISFGLPANCKEKKAKQPFGANNNAR